MNTGSQDVPTHSSNSARRKEYLSENLQVINHPAWCRACNFVHTVHGSHRHPPSCTAEFEEELSGASGGSSLECPRVSCTSSVQRPRSSALPPRPTASAPRNYSGPLARANQVLEVSGRLAIDAEAEQRGEQYVGLLCLNSFVTTHGVKGWFLVEATSWTYMNTTVVQQLRCFG